MSCLRLRRDCFEISLASHTHTQNKFIPQVSTAFDPGTRVFLTLFRQIPGDPVVQLTQTCSFFANSIFLWKLNKCIVVFLMTDNCDFSVPALFRTGELLFGFSDS